MATILPIRPALANLIQPAPSNVTAVLPQPSTIEPVRSSVAELIPQQPTLRSLTPQASSPRPQVAPVPLAPQLRPIVPDPERQALLRHFSAMANTHQGLTHAATPAHGFWQHLGRIAEAAGNVAGDVVAPGAMMNIPGTQMNREMQMFEGNAGLDQIAQQEVNEQNANARTLDANSGAQNAATGLFNAENPKPEIEASSKGIVGINPRTLEATPVTDNSGNPVMPVAREGTPKAVTLLLPGGKRVSGKVVNGDLQMADGSAVPKGTLLAPASNSPENQFIDAYLQTRGLPSTPENQLAAMREYNKETRIDPGIERGIAFEMNRPVQVVNPDNSTVRYVTAGEAERTGASTMQSIPFQTAKRVLQAFTSGAPASTLTSYNTAISHLHQLQTASAALANGDVQLFNRAAQEFAKQTGGAAPTNFEAIRAAVSGEVANVFKKSGATDQEIEQITNVIDRQDSPAQLNGIIGTYDSLLASKRSSLHDQFVQGMQSNPNFEGNSGSAGNGNPKAGTVEGGYRFKGGDPSDQKNWEKVQ